jgi:RHH-type transcriptional regulator, rel operon repressor / antitoxin RelB
VPTLIRLNARLEERLERLAKRTGRSKSLHSRRALEEYLDEQEDYLIALQRLEENLPPIPSEAVLKELNEGRLPLSA